MFAIFLLLIQNIIFKYRAIFNRIKQLEHFKEKAEILQRARYDPNQIYDKVMYRIKLLLNIFVCPPSYLPACLFICPSVSYSYILFFSLYFFFLSLPSCLSAIGTTCLAKKRPLLISRGTSSGKTKKKIIKKWSKCQIILYKWTKLNKYK